MFYLKLVVVLANIIAQFETYAEVKLARPNMLVIPLSEFPNDPEFIKQDSLKQIRANEVFYINNKGMTVAVVA